MSEAKDEQTVLADPFEKEARLAGLQITVPEEEEENTLEGVGDAEGYVPRTVAPSYDNPYFIKRGMGGYNPCILITGSYCIPNCVGYSHGRYLEIAQIQRDDRVPTCNAKDWLNVAKANGLSISKIPKVGSTMVWTNSGYGHVATVEKVYSDGSVDCSNSNYGGTRFFMLHIMPPYNLTGLWFTGFIENPYVKDQPGGKSTELQPATAQSNMYKGTYTVVPEVGLNMRYGCDPNEYESMVLLPHGTEVHCYAGYYTPVGKTPWLYAQATVNGISYTGHVCADYLTRETVVTQELRIGTLIKVKSGACDLNTGLPYVDFVYNKVYRIKELFGDRAVFGTGTTVIGAVYRKDCLVQE